MTAKRPILAILSLFAMLSINGCKGTPNPMIKGGEYGSTVASHGLRATRHRGIDYAGYRGQPVIAAAPGIVTVARRESRDRNHKGPNKGNMIEIMHAANLSDGGQHIFTVYGHLNSLEVRSGEKVERGQRIGTMGTSGCARFNCSVHVHFEVHPWIPANHDNPDKYIAGCHDPDDPPPFERDKPLVYPIAC